MIQRIMSLAMLATLVVGTRNAVGQVFFDRDDLAIVHGWVEGPLPERDRTGQQTYKHAGWRQKMLKQFPRADQNGDGTLTETEAIRYHMAQARMFTPQGKELHFLPEGTTRWTAKVPMRDGETLPTEIYLPAGQGPWPVVLVRSSRGRIDSALDFGNELLRHGYAFVGQDMTPQGDFIDADVLGRPTGQQSLNREQRASFNARRSRRHSGEDGHDAIEWIARQSWCNGKIAITGYSEACSTAKAAVAQLPRNLSAAVTAIGTLSRFRDNAPSGGRVGWGESEPQLPQSWSPTATRRPGRIPPQSNLISAAADVDIYLNDRTGWFDFATQGAIDEWVSLRHNGKSILIMGVGGHGPLSAKARLAPAYGDCDILLRETDQFGWLTGELDTSKVTSRMYYFLMGDATNPQAPGNLWKITHEWPVPHTATKFFLTADGRLRDQKPTAASASSSYKYDPKNPVLTFLGDRMPANLHGPRDQRHLADRQDILRFDTEPLSEPVEITGQISAQLYVSTDAPDTTFMVSVVDIYPDGYEWPIRDAAFMVRYRDGLASPQPAKAGEVYQIHLPMTSTALVVDRGHRIGVRVSSSNYPAYAIHPNTWDAIDSYDLAKTAFNTVHFSAEHASHITVPIVAPGVSQDYNPDLHGF